MSIDPRLADRVTLKAFAEACMVLEEGVAGVRDIDLGMMMGTGMIPGPFARADQRGLDDVLAAMEAAAGEWGEAFEPPVVLRRLVAQGRLGAKSGQGFYPYPQTADEGPVKLDTRGDTAVLWLDNPPANTISGAVVEGLEAAWRRIEEQGLRAMVLASPNPAFCAGADIKAFEQMDAAAGEQLLESVHTLLRSWERSRIVTIAAVNGLAFGGGCELAMACDVRIAASSATFGQPEVNLGIIPGFGGTQRLPRLVGEAKALEMNLSGEAVSADDAYEHGLVNRVVADHELFDEAMSWARKLGGQAPVAVEQIKRASTAAGLDEGIAAEKQGFAAALGSEDAREGIGAFLQKRRPRWQGR
jgi:enoyl-CoA hydratase / 3-hydroxyacyl-CoA dehydrogenase